MLLPQVQFFSSKGLLYGPMSPSFHQGRAAKAGATLTTIIAAISAATARTEMMRLMRNLLLFGVVSIQKTKVLATTLFPATSREVPVYRLPILGPHLPSPKASSIAPQLCSVAWLAP